MPQKRIETISAYSIDQLYNMILDIESYPKFLPWCAAARIIKKEDEEILADLVISFSGFREKYTSRITPTPPNMNSNQAIIEVNLIEGPFKFLKNNWVLTDLTKTL